MSKTIIKKQKSIFDYIVTVGSRGANRFITLVISILVARMLGAEAFGLFSLFFGIYILIFQAHAGVNIAYVRFSKIESTHSKQEIIKLSIFIQIFIFIILCLAGIPLSELISNSIGLTNPNIILYAFLSGGIIGLYGIWFGILQSEEKFGYLGLLNLLFNVIIILFIIIIWLSGVTLTLDHVLFLYVAVSAALGIISALILYRSCRGIKIHTDLRKDFSKMVMINMAITTSYFLYRYIDVYFIQYYSDLETVGIYSSAMKTSMLLNILAGSLPTILLPKAVSAAKSHKLLKNYFIKSYAISFAIIFLFMIFYFLSPFFLEILFGKEYLSATEILKWLILGWVVNVLYIPISQMFYAYNMASYRLGIELIKVALSVILFIYLIPLYGGIGAAYALLIAILITLFLAISVLGVKIKQTFQNSKA